MRIRRKKWAKTELEDSKIFISNPHEHICSWESLFINGNPITLELGCGKGIFIAQYASEHPEKNFIAIDIKTDILAVAHRNIKKTYQSLSREPTNIILIPYDIMRFENLFYDSPVFKEIVINFPNPWYKEKHYKRRLTHPRQLNQYSRVLEKDGAINLKTDDESFFRDSMEYLKECHFEIIFSSFDFHPEDYPFISFPESEHEMLYRSKGVPICFLRAKKEVLQVNSTSSE